MTTLLKIEKLNVNMRDFLYTVSPFQLVEQSKGLGRPLFNGKNEREVVAKLKYAFSIGAKPMEACALADISKDSFYRYCRKNPEFRNEIQRLEVRLTLMARVVIFKSLVSGNIKTAMWFLERKLPEEFSLSGAMSTKLEQQQQRINYLEKTLESNNIDFTY